MISIHLDNVMSFSNLHLIRRISCFCSLAYAVLWLGITVALGSFAAACSPSFPPKEVVRDFRLFGIRSSLPVLNEGDTAKLDALTYAPENLSTQTIYHWSWCPFRAAASKGYKCPVTSEELEERVAQMANLPPGLVKFPSFELGNKPTAEFTYPFSRERLELLCSMIAKASAKGGVGLGLAIPTLNCTQGYDVTIRLAVKNGEKEIVAGKRITLAFDSEAVHSNPRLLGVDIRPKDPQSAPELRSKGATWIPDTTVHEDMWTRIPDGKAFSVVEMGDYELRAALDPSSIESWQPPKPQGSPGQPEPATPPREKEAIQFSWFSNNNGLLDTTLHSLVHVEGTTSLDTISNVVITPQCDTRTSYKPSSLGCDRFSVWVVARDGRLGIDWRLVTFDIVGSMIR